MIHISVWMTAVDKFWNQCVMSMLFVTVQMGQFYYAAKAFDVLERLDPNPEYWEGKRGACVGVFQMIIAGHEPRYSYNLVNSSFHTTSSLWLESFNECFIYALT